MCTQIENAGWLCPGVCGGAVVDFGKNSGRGKTRPNAGWHQLGSLGWLGLHARLYSLAALFICDLVISHAAPSGLGVVATGAASLSVERAIRSHIGTYDCC